MNYKKEWKKFNILFWVSYFGLISALALWIGSFSFFKPDYPTIEPIQYNTQELSTNQTPSGNVTLPLPEGPPQEYDTNIALTLFKIAIALLAAYSLVAPFIILPIFGRRFSDDSGAYLLIILGFWPFLSLIGYFIVMTLYNQRISKEKNLSTTIE